MHAPSLLSRSVRIVPMFVSGFPVHPNVLGPWSIIVNGVASVISIMSTALSLLFVWPRVELAENPWGKSCVSGTVPVILSTFSWLMYTRLPA